MNFGYTALPKKSRPRCWTEAVNKIEDFGYIEEARVKFGTLPVHPLIRTHPETGKKALVHPGKLERIVGQDPDESQTFISLLDRVITPRTLSP